MRLHNFYQVRSYAESEGRVHYDLHGGVRMAVQTRTDGRSFLFFDVLLLLGVAPPARAAIG